MVFIDTFASVRQLPRWAAMSGSMNCRTCGSELGSHPHQVGERVGLHLLHDLASVRFHCDFADPELTTNLLVQQARNYQRHDLPFARSQ